MTAHSGGLTPVFTASDSLFVTGRFVFSIVNGVKLGKIASGLWVSPSATLEGKKGTQRCVLFSLWSGYNSEAIRADLRGPVFCGLGSTHCYPTIGEFAQPFLNFGLSDYLFWQY